ncbi:MAG: PmoA family protein [Lentisphaerales bacterium]|nr:PmoA family protein [Lentisphaerales bacterium]
MKKIVFLILLLCSVNLIAADFSIIENPGKNVEVTYKGKALMRFMTERDSSSKERDHDTYKVYSHIIDPIDGQKPITKGPGGKFTHHRGIFVGFKVTVGNTKADLWHMSKKARNNYKKILKQEVSDEYARLTVEIDWVNDETVLIKEERTFNFSKPEENGAFLIDLQTKLTAIAGDAKVGGDREHGGCHFRADNEVVSTKSAKYIYPEGQDVKKSTDMPWAAMTFKLAGKDYYVQHITDPKAEKWQYSAYRDYGRFGSFPTPRDVKKGESLNYRFGFYISPGVFPENASDSFVKRYAEFTGK